MKDDVISRRATIDVFGDIHPLDYNAQTYLDKIKALPSAQPTTCKYWDNESGFCALHRPSAQPEQRWIPCSERQPETSGEYLVCDEYKNILKKWYWTSMPGWTAHEGRIIAWMPLPEPWEEGADMREGAEQDD